MFSRSLTPYEALIFPIDEEELKRIEEEEFNTIQQELERFEYNKKLLIASNGNRPIEQWKLTEQDKWFELIAEIDAKTQSCIDYIRRLYAEVYPALSNI